jgi:hypothetical protein
MARMSDEKPRVYHGCTCMYAAGDNARCAVHGGKHARLLAIESAARAFEQGLDAQDLPEEKRMQLLALWAALARET